MLGSEDDKKYTFVNLATSDLDGVFHWLFEGELDSSWNCFRDCISNNLINLIVDFLSWAWCDKSCLLIEELILNSNVASAIAVTTVSSATAIKVSITFLRKFRSTRSIKVKIISAVADSIWFFLNPLLETSVENVLISSSSFNFVIRSLYAFIGSLLLNLSFLFECWDDCLSTLARFVDSIDWISIFKDNIVIGMVITSVHVVTIDDILSEFIASKIVLSLFNVSWVRVIFLKIICVTDVVISKIAEALIKRTNVLMSSSLFSISLIC